MQIDGGTWKKVTKARCSRSLNAPLKSGDGSRLTPANGQGRNNIYPTALSLAISGQAEDTASILTIIE
jgi:hypothetical protein